MRFTSRFIFIALLIALALSGLPTIQAQTACSPDTRGTVQVQQYESKTAGQKMRYSVYLPPCYGEAGAPTVYPVAYLLHGSASTDTHWLKLGLADALDSGIAAGTLPPMIVVLPYGDWIANKNRFDAVSYYHVLIDELIPNAESRYQISQDRSQRAIGGISRGGFWAFQIAFKHPDRFGSVGGHSAFFDLGHAPKAWNPLYLASDAPDLNTLRIGLDRGKQDYAAPGLDEMDKRLNARADLNYTYTVRPQGEHRDSYWSAHVADYLKWYGDGFASTQTKAPSRLARAAEGTDFNTLFVPAVAFNSLIDDVPIEQIDAIRSGELVPALILDTDTADRLRALGFNFHPDTTIVPVGEVEPTLWRQRKSFAFMAWDGLSIRVRPVNVGGVFPINYETAYESGDRSRYPLGFVTDRPNFDRGKLTRFMMSGVTAIVRDTADYFEKYGFEKAGESLRPITTQADYFHMSNEVSFDPTCKARDQKPLGLFCTVEAHFGLFPYLGVDIVELTGNHNLDFNTNAYLKTLELYKKAGIQTVGGGRDLTDARRTLSLDHHGNRIAFLACNWAGPGYALAKEDYPGAAFCDRKWTQAELATLRAEHDVVIVSTQHIETDAFYPFDQQRFDFYDFAEWGADAVFGSQAHFPQGFEFHPLKRDTDQKAFLHYGLGNLYFDQTYFQKRFFLDEMMIYDGKLLTVRLLTGIIDDFGHPRLMDDHDREYFNGVVFSKSIFDPIRQ